MAYQLGKNQYFQAARKLSKVGRALGVAVYIPFVQSYTVNLTTALTPRHSTTPVLLLENGEHSMEMERRIHISLAELLHSVRPLLVSSALWSKAHTVAPFVGAWC
jgi:hypothetical protein